MKRGIDIIIMIIISILVAIIVSLRWRINEFRLY